jgi:transcriptional regulator with XRE-family HTH domain
MATTSKLIEQLPRRLVEMVGRIADCRSELGLTQQQLADRCNQRRCEILCTEDLQAVPRMTRERVAKILMARDPQPRRAAARALYPGELKMIAHALDMPLEWLAGADIESPVVLCPPPHTPNRAARNRW